MEEPIVKDVLIHAPVSTVWKAITNKDQMKQWYFDVKEFKPVPGFKFEFYGGDETCQYYHFCKITDVADQKKLCHSWTYPHLFDSESMVCWELTEEGPDKTRVQLTHSGTENFGGGADKNFERGSFEAGWHHIVGISLKEFAEKQH